MLRLRRPILRLCPLLALCCALTLFRLSAPKAELSLSPYESPFYLWLSPLLRAPDLFDQLPPTLPLDVSKAPDIEHTQARLTLPLPDQILPTPVTGVSGNATLVQQDDRTRRSTSFLSPLFLLS